MMSESSPWYQKGLNFKCTGCGKCCTGTPGFVWVNEEEMEKMALFLKISVEDFKKRYVRKVGSRYSLTELKKNYDCVFLKEGKCKVYLARPTQCKTYPFWPQNLNSQRSWEETAKTCEGISDAHPVVSCETIDEEKLIQIQRNEKNS